MYDYISGTLVSKRPDRVVLDAGGIGWRVLVPLSTLERLPREGAKARLFVHHYLREDREALYGFATEEEREFFEALTTVDGVGPAVALGVMSSVPFDRFREAILGGDAAALTRIKGVGKKLAGRMIVELAEPFRRHGPPPAAGPRPAAAGNAGDAALALVALGYDRGEADRLAAEAVKALGKDAAPGDLVREALRRGRK